jgi:hypothetical protein
MVVIVPEFVRVVRPFLLHHHLRLHRMDSVVEPRQLRRGLQLQKKINEKEKRTNQ